MLRHVVTAVLLLVLTGTRLEPTVAQSGIAQLVAAARPSIALVIAEGEETGTGTAFAVGQGLWVTALHVVARAQRVSLRLPSGSAVHVDVVGVDVDRDIALLRGASGGPPLPLGDSSTVPVGTDIVIIGFPLAAVPAIGASDVTVTRGIVSAIRTQLGLIQVDAAMNPGVSGSPVMTLDGKVIGIADASFRGAQNVNFAIPSSAAQALASHVGSDVPPLLLPLLTMQTVNLSYTARGPGRFYLVEFLGVRCVDLPTEAVEVTSILADIDTARVMIVAAWLSFREGAAMNSPNAFAGLTTGPNGKASGNLTHLHLPPATICLNYAANLGLQFDIRYAIDYTEYRILPGSR